MFAALENEKENTPETKNSDTVVNDKNLDTLKDKDSTSIIVETPEAEKTHAPCCGGCH